MCMGVWGVWVWWGVCGCVWCVEREIGAKCPFDRKTLRKDFKVGKMKKNREGNTKIENFFNFARPDKEG